jgi:hypothetical protein
VTSPSLGLRTDAELDLDSPVADRAARRRWRGPLALLVTAVLVGAAAGAVTRTLTANPPPPAPPQAELGFAEGHLDGGTVATLRLTVHNSASNPVTVTGFEADGVRAERVTQQVRRIVPGGETVMLLVPVTADCTRTLIFTPLEAVVRFADGGTVPAVPDRSLASAGGLCRQLRAELPDGWWDPWAGATARPVGDDLQVTLPPLDPGATIVGVWAGQAILSYTGPPAPAPDGSLSLVLAPPRHCVVSPGDRVPTGLRVLLTRGGENGLRMRHTPLGPEVARWLLRHATCDDEAGPVPTRSP